MSNHTPLTDVVLAHIRENPGATKQQIVAALPDGTNLNSITVAMRRLSAENTIENRAPTAPNGRANRYFPGAWYVVNTSVESIYEDAAVQLLEELKTVASQRRGAYLARRLQELFPNG